MGLARETSSAPKAKNCVHPSIDNRGGSTIHNWGEPERAPHKRYFNARSVYIFMVRPSPARRFIDSVLRPHAMFSAVKSAWSKQLRHSTLI